MKSKVFIVLSIILIGLASLISFNTDLQNRIANRFTDKSRTILYTLSANLINNGTYYKILKIKENNKLKLEVLYFNKKKKTHELLDQITLKYKQDGHYKFGKEATNLFTTDLNNDGILEIIAPTYSPKLKPHLNIVSLNPQTLRLEWSQQNILSY